MADDNRDDETPEKSEPRAQNHLPRLWGDVNSASRTGHLFESNLPLPIPEPPRSVPGLDDTLENRQRQNPATAVRPTRLLPPIGPFDGPASPIGQTAPGPHDEPSEAGSSDRLRTSLRYGAGALIGATLLIGASILVLGGGEGDDSNATGSSTPTPTSAKSVGVETSTASLTVGSCIIIGPYEIDDPFHTNVTRVPCSRTHDAEVVAVMTTPMDLHEEIEPADIASTSRFLCEADFAAYAAGNRMDDRVQLAPLVGSRRALLVCIARYPGGRQFTDPTSASATPKPGNAAPQDE